MKPTFDLILGDVLMHKHNVSDIEGTIPFSVDWGDINGTLSDQTDLQAALDSNESKPFITVGFVNADYICDGTADNVQIQAALDTLGTEGGTVYIKTGTYSIADTITISSHNTSIIGDGISSTRLVLANSVNKNIINITNAATINYPRIASLMIDGNKANNTAGRGINVYGAWRSYLNNVRIINTAGKAISLGGSLTYKTLLANLTNLYMSDTGLEALNLEYTYDSYFCDIYSERSGAGTHGLLEQNGSANVFIRVHINGAGLHGASLTNSTESSLTHCLFENNGRAGVNISGSKVTLINCTSWNNSQSVANTYSGVSISGTSNIIQNSRCYDNQTVKTQKYGIEETGAADYNVFVNNQYATNATGNILVIGANSVIQTGQNTGDQDLSGYALLAGRAGGQILYGSTEASGTLTLDSTSNATKGGIILSPNGGPIAIGSSTIDTTAGVFVTGSGAVTQNVASLLTSQITAVAGVFSGNFSVFADPQATSNANFTGIQGTARTVVGNSQNFTGSLRGLNFNVRHQGSGIVDETENIIVQTVNNGGGTITNAYDLLILSPSNTSSTITNSYGLYIQPHTVASTLNFNLYSAGAGYNYFGGSVGVGTLVPNTPLDIGALSGAVMSLTRIDTSVTANDSIGKIQFFAKDTSTVTNLIAAEIEVQATNTVTTDINPGRIIFRTTPTTVGASLTEAMRITEAQNVGIGTTTISNTFGNTNKLQVAGNVQSSGIVSMNLQNATNSSSGFTVFKRGATGDATATLANNAEIGYNSFYGYDGNTDVNTNGYAAGAYIRAKTTEAWSTTGHGTKLQFNTTDNGATSSAENLTILQNGNVGINTVSPQFKLDVNGGVRIYSAGGGLEVLNIQYSGSPANNSRIGGFHFGSVTSPDKAAFDVITTESWTGSATGTKIDIEATPNGSTTRAKIMTLLGSGNVGIGSPSPDKLLSLSNNKIGIASDASGNLSLVSNAYFNTADGRWEITGNNYSYGVGQFSINGASFTYNNFTGSATDEKFYWVTRFAITSAGNIGVGTASPNALFDVSSATGGTIMLSRADTSVTANDVIGDIQFYAKDTSTTTNFIAAEIEVQATNTISTDINPGRMIFRTTPVGVAATPTESFRITEAQNLQFNEVTDFIFGTTTGSKIGTATNQKIAFHNATPVIQRAGAAQAAVATTGATNTTPYGYTTAAQANAIVTLVNEIRAALVEKGIIKGAA